GRHLWFTVVAFATVPRFAAAQAPSDPGAPLETSAPSSLPPDPSTVPAPPPPGPPPLAPAPAPVSTAEAEYQACMQRRRELAADATAQPDLQARGRIMQT